MMKRKFKPVDIYMTPQDLMDLTGYGRTRAYEVHRTIRAALSTQPGRVKKRLTVREYCRYMD